MRGTAPASCSAVNLRRFIPARAGNGARPMRTPRGAPVHPRACGERSRSKTIAHACLPVHPRACGERRDRRGKRRRMRVHPRACGERRPSRVSRCQAAVHPRACGERCPMALSAVSAIRFIPARAGNGLPKSQTPARKVITTVHPRACGERPCPKKRDPIDLGSSPRVRGTE